MAKRIIKWDLKKKLRGYKKWLDGGNIDRDLRNLEESLGSREVLPPLITHYLAIVGYTEVVRAQSLCLRATPRAGSPSGRI